MSHPLTKSLSALAIAAATLAAPAHADWDRADRNRLIVGLAIAGLIGLAINEAQEDVVRPVGHPLLPVGCLTRYHTSGGDVDLLDGDCLNADYHAVHLLPLDCALTIRTHGGYHSGFAPHCLARFGFHLATH